jgi:hypothetical protein
MTLGRIRNRRGAGSIGCLLMMALIAGGVYAGFQYGMPRLRYNSFSDRLNESLWNFQKQPVEDIRKRIIDMAAEFDIALTPEQVKVDVSGGKLVIDVSYEKTIDLKFQQITLPFTLHRTSSY